MDRRRLLQAGQAAVVAAAVDGVAPGLGRAAAPATATLPFGNGERPLVRYPGKRALLRLTTRPPQLETPFSVFDEAALTPNDAFFVRYHLAGAPPALDAVSWRLKVGGEVDKPLALDLATLKRLPSIEYVAVLQCSGNGRGFFEPRVGGGQAGNGLMGAARWRGVPLKAVLEQAGVKANARQVSFNGADGPPLPGVPDFVKALDIDHARDGEVMLAYAMNGQPLPELNGFPVRLVVPGWYGTYWMKHLTEISVLDKPFDGFWMASSYRIPDTDCACVEPGAAAPKTVPINRLNVRSFITNLADGARVKAGAVRLRGVAFDGGKGIAKVEVSADGGATWTPATLGPDLGRYAYRPWSAQVQLGAGEHALQARAFNVAGEGQPSTPRWNPAGYMRNVIETVRVRAA